MAKMIATAPTLTNETNLVPADLFWKLSLEQYHAMIDAGFLTENDPVELIQGWLVQKMPKNAPHTLVTRLLFDLLLRLTPIGWFVSSQEPFTAESSEPEPDLMIVRGTPRDYPTGHPRPKDLAIVIEVADATLYRDRNVKRVAYAEAGVAEYWIVNVREQQVEVHSQLASVGAANYDRQQTYRGDDQIPVIIDGELAGHIVVKDIMPS